MRLCSLFYSAIFTQNLSVVPVMLERKGKGNSLKIDLHVHSKNSDGADTVAELLENIKSAGLDVFALTDHDRTDGWDQAAKLAKELSLSFIPGIEITTEGRISGHTPFGVHLLAYLPNPDDQALKAMLAENVRSRYVRTNKFVEKLQVAYPKLSFDLVLELAQEDSTLGRPDLATALVHLGEFKSVEDVFEAVDSPISKDSPYYVRNEAPDVLDAIRIVRDAGGVPVIAHPLARTSTEDDQPISFPREHFQKMVEAGLLGIETDHREVPPEVKLILESFAAEFGLITTGSSDYHGLGVKPKNPLGLRTTSIDMLRKILQLGTGTKPTLSHSF
jgi:hypothetical protein